MNFSEIKMVLHNIQQKIANIISYLKNCNLAIRPWKDNHFCVKLNGSLLPDSATGIVFTLPSLVCTTVLPAGFFSIADKTAVLLTLLACTTVFLSPFCSFCCLTSVPHDGQNFIPSFNLSPQFAQNLLSSN